MHFLQVVLKTVFPLTATVHLRGSLFLGRNDRGHSFLGLFDRGIIKMGVTHSCDTGGRKIAAYRYKYPSANISVYAEARGVWGHPPPGKFF